MAIVGDWLLITHKCHFARSSYVAQIIPRLSWRSIISEFVPARPAKPWDLLRRWNCCTTKFTREQHPDLKASKVYLELGLTAQPALPL